MILTILLAVLLSIFSTTVMSYISMATPIGPWIAPTVVLVAMLLLKLMRVKEQVRPLSLIAVSASVGGILATAAGFSLPTLYFLSPDLFSTWMANPFYFAMVVTGLSFVAGFFGIVAADFLEERLIVQDKLAFPIGQLVYKMIAASKQIKKAYELLFGFVSAALFSFMQDGWSFDRLPGFAHGYAGHGRILGGGFIPTTITLVPAFNVAMFSIPLIRFDIWPMLWAIGFVTGHVIAIPLAVGAIAKIILVDPLNMVWFDYLSSVEFVLAFCSGMVLYGAVISFTALPAMLSTGVRWIQPSCLASARLLRRTGARRIRSWWTQKNSFRSSLLFEGGVAFFSGALFLSYFQFSIASILFLYAGAFACIYQIAVIAGKIGLAPLGRFATYVMIPAMLIFRLNEVQIVLVATFVEMCGGVAADILFGRKMARLADVDRRMVRWYQYGGLVVSSLVLGIVFWLLINHLQLGSSQLFAYKAQSRQLLIHARQFDFLVLLLGGLFSFFLKYIRVNPILVLGGLLMPINISLGLIFGGILTSFVKDREEWEPFWSGVFASNSIWMLLRSALG